MKTILKIHRLLLLGSTFILLLIQPAYLYCANDYDSDPAYQDDYEYNENSHTAGGSDTIDAQMGWDFEEETGDYYSHSPQENIIIGDGSIDLNDPVLTKPPDQITPNDIYRSDLPESGIPYSATTGYEPGNNDYDIAVINVFGREIDPVDPPFDLQEVDLQKKVNVFYAPEHKNFGGDGYTAVSVPQINATIMDTKKLRETAEEFGRSQWAQGMNQEDIFKFTSEHVLSHEVFHQVQDDFLMYVLDRRKNGSKYDYEGNSNPLQLKYDSFLYDDQYVQTLGEFGADLGALNSSRDPRKFLGMLAEKYFSETQSDPRGLSPHSRARQILFFELAREVDIPLGANKEARVAQYTKEELAADEAEAKAARASGGFPSNRAKRWEPIYYKDKTNLECFIDSLSDEDIQGAGKNIYKRVFSQEPPKINPEIPREVIEKNSEFND